MEVVECNAFLGGKKLVARDKLVFRPAAYALIVNAGRVLLMTNRRTGKYALPGGGSEVGEMLTEALMREVKEEAGIEIRIEEFLFWSESFFYYDPSDLAFHSFQFFYRCAPLKLELLADELVDDGESEKPRWIEITNLGSKDMQWFGEEIVEQLNRIGRS